jgi:signal transduction histidine kinase/ActR/RegA family two-component response regulator
MISHGTGLRARLAPAGALALQLWLVSMLCWWVVGITFSRLWWLVNADQQRWIMFCYAWEVPAVGWTGAVLLPWRLFRGLERRLAAGDDNVFRAMARYPLRVALLVLATSSVGYLLGAFQIDYFARLPPLEFIKITVEGPVVGGLFAVAAYVLAERQVQRLGRPARLMPGTEAPFARALYAKILSITLAVAVGVAVPVFLYGLTQWQLLRERTRAEAMLEAIDDLRSPFQLESLREFGPHTEALVVRRSNGFIIAGTGQGRVLVGDTRRDFLPVQRSDRGWFASRDDEHKVVAYQYRPAVLPDGDGAVIVAVSPFRDYGVELAAAARTAGLVAVGALLIGVVLAAMLARSIAGPIERLRSAAAQMAAGDLAVAPLGLVRDDEVAALAAAFDRMAARVRTDEASLRAAYDQLQQAQAELVQHERLSAVGRLISGVAHELNNPLTAVLHLAEDLQQSAAVSSADTEALQEIANQARRCRTIVQDLLSFSRGRDRRPERTELAELVAGAQRGVQPVLDGMAVRLEIATDATAAALWLDRLGLEQVLTNLLVNGAQAAGSGGVVRVTGRPQGDGWGIEVEDTGPGIAADIVPRLFEPFFTTRGEGQGTGLGLSVSLGIVQRHGGSIELDGGGSGRGARFTVRLPGPLPGQGRTAAGGHPLVMAAGESGRRPLVLIIDDERSVRMALARYFARCGWDIEVAENGLEALRMLERPEASGYRLVITDLRMPGRTGLEVHDWLADHRPELFSRLLIATGDVASPPIRAFLQRTPRPVLEKPFELSTLSAMVEQVTAGARATTAA